MNGAALTSGAKLIEPIRKKDAAIPGARTDMFPIIERGLKLCG